MAHNPSPRYGDVWLVVLDPIIGSEIGSRRPALVVSNDNNNRYSATVTVLPITSQMAKRSYLDEVRVADGTAGLRRPSRIKANMIRTIDKSRFISLMGHLPEHYYEEVNKALRIHLNMR